MKIVKVMVYKSASGEGWVFAITNSNLDVLILHRGRSDSECKDFGDKLLNRELSWKQDGNDVPGYFSAEVTLKREVRA